MGTSKVSLGHQRGTDRSSINELERSKIHGGLGNFSIHKKKIWSSQFLASLSAAYLDIDFRVRLKLSTRPLVMGVVRIGFICRSLKTSCISWSQFLPGLRLGQRVP